MELKRFRLSREHWTWRYLQGRRVNRSSKMVSAQLCPTAVETPRCKIDGSNFASGPCKPLPTKHPWIGHFISSKCGSIFAQNAPNMSTYSSIRRGCFRTDLRGAGWRPNKGNSYRRVGESLPTRGTGAETAASGKSSSVGKRENVLQRSQAIITSLTLLS